MGWPMEEGKKGDVKEWRVKIDQNPKSEKVRRAKRQPEQVTRMGGAAATGRRRQSRAAHVLDRALWIAALLGFFLPPATASCIPSPQPIRHTFRRFTLLVNLLLQSQLFHADASATYFPDLSSISKHPCRPATKRSME